MRGPVKETDWLELAAELARLRRAWREASSAGRRMMRRGMGRSVGPVFRCCEACTAGVFDLLVGEERGALTCVPCAEMVAQLAAGTYRPEAETAEVH